ncbi:AMP-dependent synthetase/ligase [Kibdelosporangium phytohabitans]|uniref:Acyl-CoA synthetase n=1 Tax=Kibdelosporangium phytohabitans TaxID=860235 RepID=A0A0N9I2S0_9PSEU|nr:long-chain fatty acid--CoA ligase [Kibdelosporangium phytohabitans]ALG12044.1 AMP-dependent synthetase [Kibdelosporangium phytohabitans]MBE1463524.1 long-chain acyl-CoA synthetase [Kibdelosporangium phytohabitans]
MNLETSVGRMFLDRAARTPHREAFRYRDGTGWCSLTWAETERHVRRLAAGLIALGVRPEQRVAIVAGTRYEWIAADLAIMCAGAATTTVYPTTNGDGVAYILADSDSQVVFAEDAVQLAKLRAHRDSIPQVRNVVLLDGTAPDDDWVLGLAELEHRGDALLELDPSAVDDRVGAIAADRLATIIYTSGTTGVPKGVRLRHSGWAYQASAVASQGFLSADDLHFLWLPMAHAFGKVLLSLQLAVGFPTAVDGRVEHIVDNLADVRPTWMAAAPRIFEKAYARIVTTMEQQGGLRKRLFDWAFAVGTVVSRLRRDGGTPGPLLAARHRVADRLVLAKVRKRFGGRIRFLVSGSAALNTGIAEWFHAAGVLILEGYGLTETTAAATINRPDHFRFGTVGPPLPGTEVRIAEDGEVLIRGAGVMAGYHNLDKDTAGALDADGWLHTGDLGERDPDGLIRITGRKKELFKTSGGKYIAPSAIESRFIAICPYASQFFVHGDGRNYCTALVTLDADAVAGWARQRGKPDRDHASVVRLVTSYVDILNAELNRWETIKKFAVLDREFSVESGELTPSLKVRRKVVEDNNRATLDAFYTA